MQKEDSMEYCIVWITKYLEDGVSPENVLVFDMDRDEFIGIDELVDVNLNAVNWKYKSARVILDILQTQPEHRLKDIALSEKFISQKRVLH